MAWVTLKLGKINQEKSLTFQVQSYKVTANDIDRFARNIQGDIRRALFKANTQAISLTGAKLTITDYNTLLSMKSRIENLNFKARNDFVIIDEKNTATAVNKVTLNNTSATGITIAGVWLLSDFNHAGTNYYTGGSYDANTRVVTLGSNLPSVRSDVLINYNYTGISCVIRSLALGAMQGQSQNYFTADIGLEGA
jgi:hypothetical protein